MLGLSIKRISQPSEKDFKPREVKNGHLSVSQIFHASEISDTKLHESFHSCLWLKIFTEVYTQIYGDME